VLLNRGGASSGYFSKWFGDQQKRDWHSTSGRFSSPFSDYRRAVTISVFREVSFLASLVYKLVVLVIALSFGLYGDYTAALGSINPIETSTSCTLGPCLHNSLGISLNF
jgi:hypothetical protein